MITVEDRYDPNKVLLHREKIKKLLDFDVPAPITVEIDPADGFCNQNCTDCSSGSGTNKKLRLINSENLIKILMELSENDVRGVEWVGGSESLLHPNISLFISVAHANNLKCGLVTNGVLLNRVFQNIINEELKYVRISLDAATDSVYQKIHRTNHFKYVINNIKRCITNGAKSSIFGISFRIMQNNVNDIINAAKLAKGLGISYIQYKYSVKNSRFLEVNDKILNAVKKNLDFTKSLIDPSFSVLGLNIINANEPRRRKSSNCISSPLVGVITAGGDIPFCIMHRNDPDWYLGNIKDGFSATWSNNIHKTMLQKMRTESCLCICKHHRYNSVIENYCTNGKIPKVIATNRSSLNPCFV